MQIIDSHSHLDLKNEVDNFAIVPSTGKQNWDNVSQYKNFALGIHPWFIDKHSTYDLQSLEQKIITHNPIAVGEIGLDFHIQTDKVLQQEFFTTQLNLAKKYNLPVIIHSVKSYDRVVNILKNYNLAVQIHAFNGSIEQGQKLLDLGCYLGFGLYKKSIKLQEFIQNMPRDKILVETDEKPSYEISKIVDEIANLKQISSSELIKIVNQNTKTLFKNYYG